ncbi:hypothetical protein E4U42_005533 [Claviceps africana]|uniref:RBR-type E3 ubiquitin transferase n=1 Tax=Claviceps africana TaxID=83212 RepID=A0A8K0J4K0_9HYPO|nr:hypothetical protein E4U42_005533 [Claviceps africana]
MTFRPIPGSFDDEDVVGLYDNALEFAHIEGESSIQAPATASWSAESRFDIDLDNDDWHRYEPPTALFKAPNVASLILLDILAQSVENVKMRVAEEDQVKRMEDERIRRAREEEATGHGKSIEPYLPIIIPSERSLEPDLSSMNDRYSHADTTSTLSITASPRSVVGAVPVPRDRKKEGRRRNDFRRLFQRAPGSGESSSAGGAREALWQKLQARLSRVGIATTNSMAQQELLALQKSGFKAEAEPLKPVAQVECVSCLDDIPVKEAVNVPCHSYCKDCFVRLVTTATRHEAQWPPKCCLNQIPFHLIRRNIPDDLERTFEERSLEWKLPVSERVYCSQPECGVWIRPEEIKLNERRGRCDRGHFTCTICGGPSHGDDDCPQDYDMTLTRILAEQEGWKRCFNCHALVEHREACEHMTCRCGSEFCYICGLRWKTCRCTAEQLNELKKAADSRREQRRVKEEREAKELQAILLQIEELEREEAARAERERLEQERLEAERWQRQIKERTRLENVRRQEVAAKFQELRARLCNLHELQHVMVQVQQEERAASLLHEAESAKMQLAERHEAERRRWQHETRARVHRKEGQFAKEYSVRVATERKVEEEYLQQLREFWKGKPRGEEEIERGMFPLQRRMDQGHKAWQKWKNEQMLLYEAKLGEVQIMKEEIMYSQRERSKELYERKELELTRRTMAEKKWFQEVVMERERLLEGWELQEVEGDADSLFTRGDGAE